MNKITLKLTGTYWKDLSDIEKKQINRQIPKLTNDPNHDRYRYINSRFNGWVILDSLHAPIGKTRMILCDEYGTANG